MKKTIFYMTGTLALAAALVACPPAADTTPPTVSLSSSTSNVVLPGSIKLTATASDDVGVSKIEFYDGTTKLGEDSSVPFEQNVDLARANNGAKSYSAKAFDAANNSASSAAVAVTVNIPEILPPTGTPASKGDLTASIGGLVSRAQSVPSNTNTQILSLNDDLNLAAIKIQAPTVVVQALSQIAGTTANLAKNAFDPVAMMKEISSMAANAQSMASTSRSTRANNITKLPVGNFDCTGTVNPCPSTTNANGDMVVTWKTKLNKTAIATIDWDASSAGTASVPVLITTSEYSGNTYQSEVPTKLVAKVTVDNIIVANLQFEATWENSIYQYAYGNNWRFSFKHLAVSGSLFSIDGATKLVDIAKLNYDYNPATGIKTSGDISVKLGDLYRAKWDINLGGIEVTPGLPTEPVIGIPGLAPFIPGNKNFKPQGALSLLISLEIGSSLYVFDTKATGWTYQTITFNSTTYEQVKSLDGVTGSAAFDGKLVMFAGKLDGVDANKNCIPFENLNLTFSDGTVTLEQFLIDRFPSVIKPGNCP
jgi:Bacterial Ig domain